MTAPTLSAGRVEVAGVSTAVIDTGTPVGAAVPPLLLLHGSGPGVTADANWRPIIPAVAASRRVVVPDQLGFGGTATGERRTDGRTAWIHPWPCSTRSRSAPPTSSTTRWAARSRCRSRRPGRRRCGASC